MGARKRIWHFNEEVETPEAGTSTHGKKCSNCGFALQMGRPRLLDDRRVESMRKKGLSYREIAKRLGCSKGGIQGAIRRIIAKGKTK